MTSKLKIELGSKIKIETDLIVFLNTFLVSAFSIFIVLHMGKRVIFGSYSGNWVYPYVNEITTKPFFVFFLIIPFISFLVYLTHKYIDRNEIKIICIWFFVGFLFQMCLQSLNQMSLGTIIWTDSQLLDFVEVTLKYDSYELLTTFNSISATLNMHAKANMPGKILFTYLLRGLTSSSQIMGYLIVLFSNIGAILTYFISKRLFNNKLTSIYSLILYLFIPAKLFFFPNLNTVSPIFILFSFLLFLQYFESHKDRYLILLGFSVYLVVFFEPLLLILGIIFLAILAKNYLEKKINNWQLLKIFVYPILSLLIFHFIMTSAFKYDILTSFLKRANFSESNAWNLAWNRDYYIWIFQNLIEFFINSGFIQTILFFTFSFNIVKNLIGEFKKNFDPKHLLKSVFQPGTLVTLSFIAVLLFIDLIGWFRGEVIRLWIFLTVFVQIVTAHFCVTKLNKRTFYLALAAVILQTAITTSMVNFNV